MKAMYDVMVAGYGPVGAVMAKLLADGGMRVLLVDKAVDIFDKPRAIGLDHEAMRILQFCGIANELFPHVRPFRGSEWHATDGTVLRSFEPASPPFELGWPPNMTFVQPQFERMLREKIANTSNIDVALQTELISFEQDSDGVTAALRDLRDGANETIRARYLIGADGAGSVVREQLGIKLEDLQFDEWWIVVDMLRKGESDYGDRNLQYCNPARPGCYVVGPGNLRRWEFRILPHEAPDDFRNPQRVLEMMAECVDITELELWRSAVYRFHALVAKQWHIGRVFLVGDAAHQTPPHLGQGLVSGLRDATNLAWKIQQVEAGADSTLFDSYMDERRPHFYSLVSKAKEFGSVIGILDPEKAKERDAQLLEKFKARTEPETRQNHIPPLVSGIFATDEEGELIAPAGHLFMQPSISIDSGSAFMDDGAQQRWQLLTVGQEPQKWLGAEEQSLWQTLRGERIALLSQSAKPASTNSEVKCLPEDGRFRDWMNVKGAQSVLVRPDRYVYGIARDAKQLNSLVRQVHEKLMNTAKSHLAVPNLS